MLVFIGMNTSIIQSFPLEFAGVGGAFSQVLFQGTFLPFFQGLLLDWNGADK